MPPTTPPPLISYSWHQAEVFGIYAYPSTVNTLGLVLIPLRGIAVIISVLRLGIFRPDLAKNGLDGHRSVVRRAGWDSMEKHRV